MKHFFSLIVFLISVVSHLNAQDYIWAHALAGGGPSMPFFESGKFVTTDANGNVYVTGSISNQMVDFDPGPGTATLMPGSGSQFHIFFAKYDASGNYVWAKIISTVGYGTCIKTDGSGNVYLAGIFNGTTDFDPGVGTATITGYNNGAALTPFFAKYDNNGNYVWAKKIDGRGSNVASNGPERNALALDGSGNIYLTGRFFGTADFDPGSSTATLTALITGTTQYADVFFAKYDNNGNYVWAKNVGGPLDDAANSVATDGSGDVFITGFFAGTADFDPGSGSATVTAGGFKDVFFGKYDTNGNYTWAKSISGPGDTDTGNSIAVDGSGNVYIGGTFDDAADFDPSTTTNTLTGGCFISNHFIAKYTGAGNYVWAKSSDNTNINSVKSECNSMVLDAQNNIYLTGNFMGVNLDFSPGTTTVNLSSTYVLNQFGNPIFCGSDMYFSKFDNNGNHVFSKLINRVNNSNNFYSSTDIVNDGRSIHVSASGQIHLTGYFSTMSPTSVDFDPGAGTATLVATGGSDIFLAKYNSCPTPTLTVTSGTICEGQTFTLNVGGANTYSVNGTSATVYTYNPISSTVYSVTGTNSLFCSALTPVTATITVKPSPTVTAANGTVCAGDTFTINATGAVTYSINGVAANNLTVVPAASSVYSVTGTATNGCVSGNIALASITAYSLPVVSVASGSICAGEVFTAVVSGAISYSLNGVSASVFTFNPLTTTSYSVSGSNTLGCVSQPAVVTITVNALPIVAATSGTLCHGDVFNLNLTGADTYSINGNSVTSFTVNPVTTTSYSVTGTSTAGCVSANTTIATVSVFSLPTVSATGGTLCAGQVYTISASGVSSYSVNGSALNTLTFSPSSNTTYSLTGSSLQGCVSGNTAVVTLSVFTLPVFSVNSLSACLGSSVSLVANGTDSYSWSTQQTGSSIVVAPALTSTYSVVGTDNLTGCSSLMTATVTIDSTNINLSGVTTVCVNETVSINASGASTYTWSTSGNGSGITVAPLITTVYTVQGTGLNGCLGIASKTVVVDACTGFAEKMTSNAVWKVYPVPATDVLIIETALQQNDVLFIYNSCGQQVKEFPVVIGNVQLDISELPAGIYFLRVGGRSEKFIKN